jgi:uncharacterized membrane protein YkoI
MIERSCGIHRAVPKRAGMIRRALSLVALIGWLTAWADLVSATEDARVPATQGAGASAAEQAQQAHASAAKNARACLSKSEQRAAISAGQAVTLAQAIRSARGSVRGHGSREVVNAKLCREEKGLVYLLTVLSRDGKVTHTTVDATSGKVVEAAP